jgi:hypothetical protein
MIYKSIIYNLYIMTCLPYISYIYNLYIMPLFLCHLVETLGTNREKKDLFVVAVHSAGGDTLPVNLTVIPSGQKWVFDTMYKTAFPHLYTTEVCSMNRLVLTDKDKSEYEPFELAIETTNDFQ